MPLSPPPSYDNCQAPPLPVYPTLQTLNYDHVGTNTDTTERKGVRPESAVPPTMPNPMILPPALPPGGVEGPPMLPPYPYPPQAPPYQHYNVGYYTPMNGVNCGPLGGVHGEPQFCQGLRAGNGLTTPQGGRFYGKWHSPTKFF